MAKTTKAQRNLAEAAEFRAVAKQLLYLGHRDWNDWELDWLGDEVRRRPDYLYTENEWAVLNRLQHNAKSFTGYADYTVPELVRIAYAGRYELGEEDREFVEKLHRWSATDLKRRQIRLLAGICRLFENIGYDDLDEPEQDLHQSGMLDSVV
jgi:hypothetical protein